MVDDATTVRTAYITCTIWCDDFFFVSLFDSELFIFLLAFDV